MINDTIVGIENLPNVFIDKVQVFSRSNGFRLNTRLKMCDHIDNPSWKRDEMSDMKIKVSYVSTLPEIQSLNTGESSLFDYKVGSTRTRVFPSLSFTEESIVGEYKVYSFTTEEVLPFFPFDLNIYAACFVENLGFNNHPLFSKYYGPMASEKIFVGGDINTLSNYFYYPDTNEEYGGPVHQKPDGSYMEGSEHTEAPHKEVVLVSEENYKIQAFNVDFDLANEVFAGRNIGNVSVRSTGRSDADVDTSLSAINPLYAASAMTTLQRPATMQRIDPEFNPPDPVSIMPVATGITIVQGLNDESSDETINVNVSEPNFNLVGNPTPTNIPRGY